MVCGIGYMNKNDLNRCMVCGMGYMNKNELKYRHEHSQLCDGGSGRVSDSENYQAIA